MFNYNLFIFIVSTFVLTLSFSSLTDTLFFPLLLSHDGSRYLEVVIVTQHLITFTVSLYISFSLQLIQKNVELKTTCCK